MSCSTSSTESAPFSRPMSAIIRSDSSGPIPAIGSSRSSSRAFGRQREADLELALLAVRERARGYAGARGEADALEHGARLLEERRFRRERAPEREARAAARLHRERDVVEDGEARKRLVIW